MHNQEGAIRWSGFWVREGRGIWGLPHYSLWRGKEEEEDAEGGIDLEDREVVRWGVVERGEEADEVQRHEAFGMWCGGWTWDVVQWMG